MILRKSVEYIRYLQQLVTAQGARNRELEEQLKGLRGDSGSASPPSSMGMSNEFGMGGWGAVGGLLASMPEGADEDGALMGMEVDGVEGEGEEVKEEEKRGRRAKRSGGVLALQEKKAPAANGRKVKKGKVVQEFEGEDDCDEGSELSDDGMDS
ncbi:hypothetical protein B0H10DRAFT_355903 [Mycena sp. CBHHK59/15]|nr:hypothetical protein B0H10DRAFT_355903 [Mycena sp. CBHHK59/15]